MHETRFSGARSHVDREPCFFTRTLDQLGAVATVTHCAGGNRTVTRYTQLLHAAAKRLQTIESRFHGVWRQLSREKYIMPEPNGQPHLLELLRCRLIPK